MAISKERLEELIEQGATIYRTYANVCVQEIKLNKAQIKIDSAFLWQKMTGAFKGCGIPLEQLFETEEEAEWHKEFGNIPRTDFLKLPTFEDFSKLEGSVQFYHNGTRYAMYVFVKNRNTNNCRIIIRADDGAQDWLVFQQPLTKENYIKACRKVKELFLGE